MGKAKMLHECLPQYTLEFLLGAVESAGTMPVEEIMENLI